MKNIKLPTNRQTSARASQIDSFDFFKCFAAFLVVSIHVSFQGIIGDYINVIARISVPFFFLVSGFFSYQKESGDVKIRKKRMRKIKKYFVILLGVTVVYFLYEIAGSFSDGSFQETIKTYLSFPFLIAHLGPKGSHLWFIRALIYLEIMFLFFEPLFRKKAGGILLLIAWLFDVLALKYSNILFGFEIMEPYDEILTKYIGCAFVYYMAGYKIHCYETQVVHFFERLGIGKNIGILLILVLMNILEYTLLEHYNVNHMPINYFTTFFLALVVFSLLLLYRSLGRGSIFSYIGRELSMYIYYWHLLIFWLEAFLLSNFPALDILYKNPIMLYIQTVIFSMFILYFKNTFIKIKR